MKKFCIVIFVGFLFFLLYKFVNTPETSKEIKQKQKIYRQSKEKSPRYGVKYYKVGNRSEYIILNKNGTCKIKEPGRLYIVRYEMSDNEITFKRFEKITTAIFKDGVIIDSKGNSWQRITQSSN